MDFMDMVAAWVFIVIAISVAHHRLRERSKAEERRLRVLDLTGWRR